MSLSVFDVKFVWGTSDAVAPKTIPSAVLDAINPTREVPIVWLFGIGHFLMLEDPEAFVNAITSR